jgi:hypothetical protein
MLPASQAFQRGNNRLMILAIRMAFFRFSVHRHSTGAGITKC